MKDNIMYVFNGHKSITVKKNEILNELIDNHVKQINLSLERNRNKLNKIYVSRLEKFMYQENVKFTDENNNRVYSIYKAYKIDNIKLLIYDNSDNKKLDLLNSIELHEKILDIDDIDTEN